ncbi:hypothetical protein CLAFUW4_01693 [Fulvia fulva]|uniref:Knr4/Smi1-like domain-containing protein n=1 Tax=Passalora fulva TaxID=5499 RepID=A0A9Q8P3Q6_PASFU|nr:uncharacterized protein CLAFUR5_01690 [Fulvia fulva]KAK4634798.1 hypothetical protein CLAFUR4_01691 [Fulvia fulva]KAK4637956.1 hypothetical protein CLAFUR0_01692 [Fulvia fulva]UJO12178.1 hypothetical protein CLAFUR5_01690 [Fulvia fulva]WPV08431.1 hypothetical protein CLAFUW4_01693 [Fulvia fulva]WPV25164.1 hypothetical protein CLAFUW7_01695 [Fulvia fulva]
MTERVAEFPFPSWDEDVLEERYTVNIIGKALRTALDVMIFGDVESANKILNLMYSHNALEYGLADTRVFMHYAWNASGCWPTHIGRPEQDRLPPARDALIQQQGGIDGPGLIPHLQGLSRKSRADLLDKDPADAAAWSWGDLEKACRMIKMGTEETVNTAVLPLSVEIALELEKHEIAEQLIRQHLVRPLGDTTLLTHPDSLAMLHSPRIWKLLCEGWLRRELQVSPGLIKSKVEEVLRLLEKRLLHVPLRPFRDYSIDRLVQSFNATCLENRRLGGIGATRLFKEDAENEDDKLPATFLKAPAAEDMIQGLEDAAKTKGYTTGLPQDYKAFLRVTDGIYAHDHTDWGDNIFRPVRALDFDDAIDWCVELLPTESLGFDGDIDIDWPAVDVALNIGAGGDEGNQWLVPADLTTKAKEAFLAAYSRADPVGRIRMERAAKDLYGSVEDLMKLDYVILRMYHWTAELECFASFHHLLQATLMEAIKGGSEGSVEGDEDAGYIHDETRTTASLTANPKLKI